MSVNYTTGDVTAQAGGDYQAAVGVVTFARGETAKQLSVRVNGDTQVESNETFVVNLYNLINAGVGKTTGLGTILNDDTVSNITAVQFGQATYNVQEDLGLLTIAVIRTGDVSGPSTVDYKTVNSTATQKADFEYTAGTLTFAPGETGKTLQLLINEDMYQEGNESFSVALSNPAGATLGAQTGDRRTSRFARIYPNHQTIRSLFIRMPYHLSLLRPPTYPFLTNHTNQSTYVKFFHCSWNRCYSASVNYINRIPKNQKFNKLKETSCLTHFTEMGRSWKSISNAVVRFSVRVHCPSSKRPSTRCHLKSPMPCAECRSG